MKKIIILFLIFVSFTMYSQTSPGEYTVKLLKVNTKYSDFGTTFFGKDKVVFASPKDNAVLTKTVWEYNKQPFLDLFVGTINKDNEIVDKRRVVGDINTKFHEGVVSFTKDLKTVYYSANNTVNNKAQKDSTGMVNIQLYRADVSKSGAWNNVVKLSFNNDQYSTGHPALSLDDTKLYFISDRPESIGKTDIYVVDINDDGTYSDPKNLGAKINTEEREMFPFISDDNVLYYSSNGLAEGYGDLDVFASKMFDNTVADPINLGEPVNSKKDDFAYIIDDSKLKGFFSSNRKGGKGDDDIYTFTASPGIFFECNQVVLVTVRDKETQELLPGAVVVVQDEEGNELFSKVASEEKAQISFELPCDTPFKLIGTTQGYLREELKTKTVNDIDVGSLELFLDLAPELKVVDEKIMININTIYFDFDKWVIRPEAAKELDKVIAVMKEHPSMVIEGGSHTDSRAKEAYNQILSEKRAKATVDYIVAGGIDRNRLTSKGYGEMQLVNNCSSFVKCSREEHQLNRRTEFVIVNDSNRFVSTSATLANVKVDRSANITVVDIDGELASQQVEKVSSGNLLYHIIAGGFKNHKNATKKLNQLKAKGYNARILGKNKWGLTQVSFESYNNREDALQSLSRIKRIEDKKAWLLIKKIASVAVAENIITKNNNVTSVKTDEKQEIESTAVVEENIVENNLIIPSVKGDFVKIDPIYFGFDKWSLSNGELRQLDGVVQVMKDNPAIIVEAGAHTDSKNREAYNQILSDKRAKTVVEYIVSKGISRSRVTGKGYGETRYVNHCRSFVKCTAKEQQENRRIEFMIVSGNGYPKEEISEKTTKFINTNPIYFDFDKYDIRKDAAYELERVIRILKENSTMIVEAGSHTDSKNREAYNQILSKNRAKSVKNYMVARGIDASRIVSKGYGELELVNNCSSFVKCTAKEHQENRRTEFKIIKM